MCALDIWAWYDTTAHRIPPCVFLVPKLQLGNAIPGSSSFLIMCAKPGARVRGNHFPTCTFMVRKKPARGGLTGTLDYLQTRWRPGGIPSGRYNQHCRNSSIIWLQRKISIALTVRHSLQAKKSPLKAGLSGLLVIIRTSCRQERDPQVGTTTLPKQLRSYGCMSESSTIQKISHGRDARYRTPPAQTRTCSFPASGSSVVLAFAQVIALCNST
uniref:Uncharacterized protein n=1 Tax=Candidatus Kentrum sp. DK TaxID=2126562 RepID=A0A450TNT2_9GAMM|nr:MAG: hypothetical protein BECKDK2373B_GA0170837_12461 [Candidatus Kentron sp. DK]